MNVIIVGKGKLAKSLMEGLKSLYTVIPWDEFDQTKNEKNIMIHTGSGRQLPEVISFCNKTKSICIELSTGSLAANQEINFPKINCPNTAIPLIKIMNLLSMYGTQFRNYKIKITESHQKSKVTVAGTALEIAKALGYDANNIESVRDENIQKNLMGIPEKNLDLHAYHKIVIEDEGCEIKIETKVLGHAAYVFGVQKIIESINKHELENREYHIHEFIQKEWL